MDPLGPLSTSSPDDPLVQLAQQYWPPASDNATAEAQDASQGPSATPSKKKGGSTGKKKSPKKSEQPPEEQQAAEIDDDMVDAIYYGHLKAHENRIDQDRLKVLEFTGFLERYIWPNFDANKASFAQMMLILLIVIEKNRQNIETWATFEQRELEFRRFFAKLLTVPYTHAMNPTEWEAYTHFLVLVFQSLENPTLRTMSLRLVSIGMWRSIHDGLVEVQLRKYPQLSRMWSKAQKIEPATLLSPQKVSTNPYGAEGTPSKKQKRSRGKRPGKGTTTNPVELSLETQEMVNNCSQLREQEISQPAEIPTDSKSLTQFIRSYEPVFLPQLVATFIQTAQEVDPGALSKEFSVSVRNYMERSLEFFIDLLSQIPTRRFFRLVVLASNLRLRVHDCAWNHLETDSKLFGQLVDILEFFQGFEVDEHTGEALSREDILSIQYEKLQLLQRVAYSFYPKKLKEFALSAVGNIAKADSLKEHLKKLDESELLDVSKRLQLLPGDCSTLQNGSVDTGKGTSDAGIKLHHFVRLETDRESVLKLLAEHHKMRPSALEQVNKLPLFPNEKLLWDRYLVPFGKYYGNSVLALPKLNLQFLTIDDYLLRSFNLYRLEAAYEIREDIIDSVKRLGPKRTIDYAADGTPEIVTRFTGWSRMALNIEDFSVTSVSQPRVGHEAPAAVTAEVKYDLSRHADWIKKEWDNLREHDVCFLVTIRAPSETVGGGSTNIAGVSTNGNGLDDDNRSGNKRARESQNGGQPGEHPKQDEEEVAFPFKYGVVYVRGCEIVRHYDEQKNLLNDPAAALAKGIQGTIPPKGHKRTLQVKLDPNQYHFDVLQSQSKSQSSDVSSAGLVGIGKTEEKVGDGLWPGQQEGEDVYQTFNVLLRRSSKENNFKSILETIRQVMNMASVGKAIPSWLYDVFLGYGDPAAASFKNLPGQLEEIDLKDTLVSKNHAEQSLSSISEESLPVVSPVLWQEIARWRRANPSRSLPFDLVRKLEFSSGQSMQLPFRVKFKSVPVSIEDVQKTLNDPDTRKDKPLEIEAASVSSYHSDKCGPYPEDQPNVNTVPFTNVQMEAIRSGINPGLTMVVGPPGTGKTDVAVQTISNIYHNFPNQRTLLVTHSNHALNDLFEKLAQKDIHERHMLRLGMGERDLQLSTSKDFSKWGRVNDTLERRLELLNEVQRLGKCIQVVADVGSTCETAENFYHEYIISAMEVFNSRVEKIRNWNQAENNKIQALYDEFPFRSFFANVPGGLENYLKQGTFEESVEAAVACFKHVDQIFTELRDYRAFELLRTHRLRSDYLLTNQAKIVAMTCTHAALNRQQLVDLNFKYDNIIMEEAAQVLEVETFIPMLLQQIDQAEGCRLKRVMLIGDHHQLPPVVKNMAFQKYGKLDQSLFTRFIRLGSPFVQLNQQARCRPSIAELYRWRYSNLGDMENVLKQPEYRRANAGLEYEYQLIDVPDFNGQGEIQPSPYFYQNLGEAEYVIALYQYMRLLGYPSEKITLLTTYNGQKNLLHDVAVTRCKPYPWFGMPSNISTVDKFQGQQNDYVLLSLVRTKNVGHIRDVRRLVVALSRARLGLYVFCRKNVFSSCVELSPVFKYFNQRPSVLSLVPGEKHPAEKRQVGDSVQEKDVQHISGVEEMGKFVYDKTQELMSQLNMPAGAVAPPTSSD
eukprot:gb/GECG01000999.1/.p1 GENE.gb/GECG01000999.1/~~gb/GECG01000999.1/.p1  ORF type:complete len:1658 (+),score=245.61 gb/GECG01000999.1/:1-4974(+)